MEERRPIQVLPESVILKIAAGEVIERPASVVKELVENAIDAGASRIEIDVVEGGRKSIVVADDGLGMTEDEARLALQPHATSKISSFEDLTHISTLGFRGEALAAISSVSKLDVISRTQTASTGTRIRCEGGRVQSIEPFGTPTGTIMSVSHLFFNTPARRKFLRTKKTELAHIENYVRKVALAELSRTFVLQSEGEMVLNLAAAETLQERLQQLYSKETTQKLLPLAAAEGALRLDGFVSNTHLNFGRPNEVWLFVNRRPVRDRLLTAAVLEGYRSVRMERRYPLAVINLSMPKEEVDVNVHPTKAEVRFENSSSVFRFLSKVIADTLRGPENVGLSFSSTVARETPPSYATQTNSSQGSLMETFYGTPEKMMGTNLGISPSPPREEASASFSQLDYLGSLDHTYLLCRGTDSLVVIDQHAAHERVKFEQLKSSLEQRQEVASQRLLVPLTLEVTAPREEVLEKMLPDLRQLGFEIEPFGSRTFVISAVPEIMENHDPRPLLTDLADDLAADVNEATWKNHLDHVLSTVACHSAVRAHDTLSREEVESLLKDLDAINFPTNCPHGRPTFLRFDLHQLEKLFHRK